MIVTALLSLGVMVNLQRSLCEVKKATKCALHCVL